MQAWLLLKTLIFLPALVTLILMIWLSLGIWTALDNALVAIQGIIDRAFDEQFFD